MILCSGSFNFSSVVTVARILSSSRILQLYGHKPRAAIATVFFLTLSNDSPYALLINGIISYGSMTGVKLSCSFFCIKYIFAAVVNILYVPFCSGTSLTCQISVPYGTPKHKHQRCNGSFIYFRNGNSIRLHAHPTRITAWCQYSNQRLRYSPT